MIKPSCIEARLSMSRRTKPWLMKMMTWWRHQMETFSALLALLWGNHRSSVNSPHKGQWRIDLMCSLTCAWINGWVNNREAGELRLHCAHYDIIVMTAIISILWNGDVLNFSRGNPMIFQLWEMAENAGIYFTFPHINSACEDLKRTNAFFFMRII